MPSIEYDLAFFHAGVIRLDDYLHSKELYYPTAEKSPSGKPPFPRLTPGGLLLAQTRLHARQLDPPDREELTSLDEQFNLLKKQWRVAWEKKVVRDFNARLILWKNFLEDHRKNPGGHYDRYGYEVRSRVILYLLSLEGVQIPSEKKETLTDLDRRLRLVFVPGEFIWDNEIIQRFPREPYWYLYGEIQEV